jgi:hypothetical protein
MLDPQREIQALVDTFVADLSELAKRIAIEQIHTAFGVGAKLALAAPAPRTRKAAAPPVVEKPARRGRARRAAGELEELRDKLLAAVAEKPGRRTEELNEALGTETPQIAQLLRRLVSEDRIRTEGARRGTRYFLASEAPPSRRPAPQTELPLTSEEPQG